ncbi:Hint domain-containing protein [uncultured Tateyamaria sp.]|uniref:Hint domain-containing protein n=1 Tax=uncultured Tateyamaria sp. TaxID=455651 RepID=UPI00262B061C|nr:Hint domain-containing protein [uncultured Tateyamaria sp.]
MVLRTFVAIDSENLVVQSSSSAGIVGNPIINNSSTPNGTVFTYTQGSGRTITLDDTSGDPDVFEDDQSGGHTVVDGAGLVANGNGVEAESLIQVRALDAGGNQVGPVITITVFSQNGNTGDVWGFSSDAPLGDGVSYEKVSGSNAGSSSYTDFVTCFGPGSMIAADGADIPVEALCVGDKVWTAGNGLQPVRWIGRSTVIGAGAFAPVVIAPGAMGNAQTLKVSQEHRMFFDDASAAYLFGASEVLIAAKHLTDLPGVSIIPQPTIEYTHFMFDTHEVVSANGILSESFFLSEMSIRGLGDAARAELLALFPCWRNAVAQFGTAAAVTLKQHEATAWAHYRAA